MDEHKIKKKWKWKEPKYLETTIVAKHFIQGCDHSHIHRRLFIYFFFRLKFWIADVKEPRAICMAFVCKTIHTGNSSGRSSTQASYIMLLKQQQKKNEAAQQMYDGTMRCSHVDLEYLTLI